MTRVTVWSEFRHEKKNPIVAKIYPDGMHNAIGNHLKKDKSLDVRTATLDEKDHGLPQSVIDATDVFVWWGHLAHHEVSDKTVEAVHNRILAGAGIVVLHSGHFSKIFKRLMGTTCNLKWRRGGERAGNPLDHPPRPSNRLRARRLFHPPARGDVRRILRHPRAAKHVSYQQLRRRGGVPLRMHLDPRRRQSGLLPPRPRNVSNLPRQKRAESDRKRREVGGDRMRHCRRSSSAIASWVGSTKSRFV